MNPALRPRMTAAETPTGHRVPRLHSRADSAAGAEDAELVPHRPGLPHALPPQAWRSGEVYPVARARARALPATASTLFEQTSEDRGNQPVLGLSAASFERIMSASAATRP